MFLLRWLRFFRGTVRFHASGVFLERFLERCIAAGIPLWSLEKGELDLWGETTPAGARRMEKFVSRTGVKLEREAPSGFLPLLCSLRGRLGLAAALILFFGFQLVMGQYIWNIEISGLETIPEPLLREQLASLGLDYGAHAGSIDPVDLEYEMMLLNHDLGWIAINLNGSTARVEVDERTAAPEKIDDQANPCNILAAQAGQIISMEVYDGKAAAAVGDGVAQGDILVSGVMTDAKGNTILQHARAKIIARVEEEVRFFVPFEEVQTVYSGQMEKKYSARVLGIQIPLGLPRQIEGRFKKEVVETPLSIGPVELPITYVREYYLLARQQTLCRSEEEALQYGRSELERILRQQYPEGLISSQLRVQTREDGLLFICQVACEKDIAQPAPILVRWPEGTGAPQ